jgi:hypothetical protein
LTYQNQEKKEKRAQEVVVIPTNSYQNQKRKKRAQELVVHNNEQHQNQAGRERKVVLLTMNSHIKIKKKEKRAQDIIANILN